ncbi:MAG: hypothetical protein WCD04_07475 [Terriglobia bacterium]|jgi:hypothetical protein
MRDIVSRALRASPELAAELLRRGIFSPEEKAEFLQFLPDQSGGFPSLHPGPVQFATLLAQGDTQLGARVVLRNLMRPNELTWLYRLLRFQEPSDKRDELVRIVERALEGRKGNVRNRR